MFNFVVLLSTLATASAASQWCGVASDSTGQYLTAAGYACSKILTSSDFGVTWTYSKAPDQWWGSIFSDSGAKKLFIAPHYVGGSTYKEPMMYSTDRGLTWSNSTYNNEASNTVTMSNKVTADSAAKRMVACNDARKLMQSRDGGATWFGVDNVPYINYPSVNGYASAISGSGNVIYATNDAQEVCVSKDAGLTWTNAAVPSLVGEWRNFLSDATGAILFAHTYKSFYVSTNYGVQFNILKSIPSTSSVNIIDIAADPAGKYCYVLATDGLYTYTRSTNTLVLNPNIKIQVDQGYSAYGIAVSSSGQHIIASVQPVGLYISDDFGNTWKLVPGLTN